LFRSSALLPNRKFFFEGWSTVDWDAVTEWTVVINASTIPKLSFMIFAIGARQFVVQDAFEIIVSVAFNSLWLTPITNIGAVLEGAEITTFLAPAFKCAEAESISLKIPVQSIIISAPTSSHFKFSGFFSEVTLIFFPSTIKSPFFTSTFPGYFP